MTFKPPVKRKAQSNRQSTLSAAQPFSFDFRKSIENQTAKIKL
jgi:hypothetical protein